jgi:hypothetical protein
MLCVMHLGSVLVGIVVGLVLGLLVGRLVRRPLRSRAVDDSPPLAGQQTAAQADPVSRQSADPGPQGTPAERGWAASASELFPVPAEPGPALEPAFEPAIREDHSLMEALREVNERLNKEAQTRLSRGSGDSSADPDGEPALVSPPGSGGTQTSGQDLLERSRKLAEDAKLRLSREAGQENP